MRSRAGRLTSTGSPSHQVSPVWTRDHAARQDQHLVGRPAEAFLQAPTDELRDLNLGPLRFAADDGLQAVLVLDDKLQVQRVFIGGEEFIG